MSAYVDHKYLNLISPRLKLFKRKSRDLYNFRCPLCGDSKKNQYKARGYAFLREQSIFYKCHNCGESGHLKQLLEKIDPIIPKQYNFETFTNKEKICFPTKL